MAIIAICDDEAVQLKQAMQNAEAYGRERGIVPYEIRNYDSPLELLRELEEGTSFDVCLLDICMPGMTGIDLAKQIRKLCVTAEIIFLTNSADYAIDAFALKATHYILKPYTQLSFFEAMDRAFEMREATMGKNIVFKAEGGVLFSVAVDDIIYIEANRHTLALYAREQNKEIAGTLSQTLAQLQALGTPLQFVMPFKGYILNQKNVKEISPKEISMIKDFRIPMARGKFKEVKDAYFEYVFEEKES